MAKAKKTAPAAKATSEKVPVARPADQVMQMELQNMLGAARCLVRMSGKVVYVDAVGSRSVHLMLIGSPGKGKTPPSLSIACTPAGAKMFLAAKAPAGIPPHLMPVVSGAFSNAFSNIIGNDVGLPPEAAAKVVFPILKKFLSAVQKIVSSAMKTGHATGLLSLVDIVPAELLPALQGVRMRVGKGAAVTNYRNLLKSAKALRIDLHVMC